MYSYLVPYIVNALKDSFSYTVSKMDNNQEIISRLKFIGKLKKGEKINTRHMYVQPCTLSTSISRTFLYQDNRGNALNFVQDTISRAFELLITYERSEIESEIVLSQHLVKDLQNAAIGLANLKFTYESDTKFCCDMDTLLEYIHARLARFIMRDDNLMINKRDLNGSPKNKKERND